MNPDSSVKGRHTSFVPIPEFHVHLANTAEVPKETSRREVFSHCMYCTDGHEGWIFRNGDLFIMNDFCF